MHRLTPFEPANVSSVFFRAGLPDSSGSIEEEDSHHMPKGAATTGCLSRKRSGALSIYVLPTFTTTVAAVHPKLNPCGPHSHLPRVNSDFAKSPWHTNTP